MHPDSVLRFPFALTMWDEKPNPGGRQGHYVNMSNTKYTMVACGFYETANHKVRALQNFK
jgi:hypothetical protein